MAARHRKWSGSLCWILSCHGISLGLLILFGFTVAIFYHLANGIRHLFWDAGTGYKPETATMTAWVTIIVGIVGAVALWAIILAA